MKKYWIFSLLLGLSLIWPVLFHASGRETTKAPRPIEIADIMAWKDVAAIAISPDGRWFAYTISSREGYHELIIQNLPGKKGFKLNTSALNLTFSEDSRWLGFTMRPDEKQIGELEKQGKRAYDGVGLVDVTTGAKKEFMKIKRFVFSARRPTCLALHSYPAEGQEENEKQKFKGSTLFLYEPAAAMELSIGNVAEFEFDSSGRWLAWLIDAVEQRGNGLQVRNLETGQILPIDIDSAFYEGLLWTKKGEGLCALKAANDKNRAGQLYCVIGARGFSRGRLETVVYKPEDDQAFPKDMMISPYRKPRWTDDLNGFLFGIGRPERSGRSRAEKAPADCQKPGTEKIEQSNGKELPDLVLWHWLDKRLPSQQQVEEKKDREANDLCVYWIPDKKFVRLGNGALKDVADAPRQRWAVGFDSGEYEYTNNLTGLANTDIYAINMRTGERRPVAKRHRLFNRPHWTYSFSPDGRHFLYYQEGHFFTFDLNAGLAYNITKDVPTSFVDEENTYNVKNPPIQPIGWDQDGSYVLLYDNWDAWKIPVHGGPGVNLTVNGKADGIRYKQIFELDPEAMGIDLSKSLYFQVYGEWTKKAGIVRIDRGWPGPKMLLWEAAVFDDLAKAKNSETYFYSKETNAGYNLYYTDGALQNGVPMYDFASLHEGFLWSSGVRLLDYKSAKGDKLQAALILPANYEEGKTYPAIVSIYEKLSSWLNRYFSPGFGGLDPALCTSHGYAVLFPDIINRINDPATSAVWCVLPAVEAAIATGIVDRNRIGLTGHSMGGWETAFLITQTDIFRAAVAGAPLANLTSMYGSIYGRTGQANAGLFEHGQARLSKGYWEDLDAFIRNSPVFFADRVHTPLLIIHNDKDGSVDWNQGMELFNVLRRLQKPVIMLQYKGEDHYLSKRANQKDFTLRMKEFFDHYLRGMPAPRWLQEGIPLLEMDRHLKERTTLE